MPIVERQQDTEYGDRERNFQLYRRGRYVEFNLVYDRGTIFGLQTKVRTESILMSLPFLVRWEYGYTIKPGTPEAELYEILRTRLQIPKARVPSYSVISYGDAQFRLPRATTSV